MEFLIKKLGYEKRIKDLGIKPLNDEMNEQQYLKRLNFIIGRKYYN